MVFQTMERRRLVCILPSEIHGPSNLVCNIGQAKIYNNHKIIIENLKKSYLLMPKMLIFLPLMGYDIAE